MSSSSTTWTTDTNTKSGVVQVYSSNVSVLKVVADEGGSAILDLFADQGDDNADKWRMWVNASDDDLHFSNYTSGTAWTDILTLQDGGNVGIGTATPDQKLDITGDGASLGIGINCHSDTEAHSGVLQFNKSDNTGASKALVDDDAVLGDVQFRGYDGDAMIHGAGIIARTNGTPADNVMPTDLEFWTNDGSTSLTQRMTISESGKVGIGIPAPALPFHVADDASQSTMRVHNTYATFASIAIETSVDRAANTGYFFINGSSNYTSGADAEFKIDGAGQLFSDTAAHGGAADYAEYFETFDGNAISVGSTVVLIDGKVRVANSGETPFGVVRPEGATNVGNTQWARWQGKRMTDDYGAKILTSDKDVKINPEWDSSKEYIPRSERDEWQIIGLLGQVPITKGQQVASSWIKMSEVSDNVDMYFIK